MHIDYSANNWRFSVPPIGFDPTTPKAAQFLPRIVSSRPWPRIRVPTPGRCVKENCRGDQIANLHPGNSQHIQGG